MQPSGSPVVTWSEMLSVVAALGATGSLLVAYLAYRIAVRQALPHPEIGWMSSSTGSRSLDFTIKRTSDNADWVVASASIRHNWRRRRHLALGVLEHEDAFEGNIYRSYRPSGPWQNRIIFDPPLTEGAIVIHHEAPDCEVKLKLTLRTLPSPTVVRRIKLRRYRSRAER